MRYLLPIIASSALVAAAPAMVTVYDTVTVTAVDYVDESAPTGGPAVPYFQAPAPAPAPAATSVPAAAAAPAPAPVVYSSSSAAPAAPAVASAQAVPVAAPSKAAPAAASSAAASPAASKPSDLTTPANKNGQNTQSQTASQNEDSILGTMSEAQVLAQLTKCWGGSLPWPIPNTPMPCADVVAPQLSLFPRPATKPNMLIVNNYCDYDIYYQILDGPTTAGNGVIKAGIPLQQPLSATVLKASKTPPKNGVLNSPALIEYGNPDGNIYYDLSLINCITNGDVSACPGHEAGLQMGGPQSKTFQCAPGAWCDDQVYMYQENLCKVQNPVSATPATNGLTVDFCASQKH